MNYRTILCLIGLFSFTGCPTPQVKGEFPPPKGDLTYLLSADPAAVTSAELLSAVSAAEERIAANHVVDGIFWQAVRSDPDLDEPDMYGTGGDSMIFSGNYLAACSYKYGITRNSTDLGKAIDALRGLYILTHISGTPGVLARCAFPTSRGDEWGYPGAWGSRIASGFVYDSPTDIDDPFNSGHTFPQMTFYTRATRDQLTGLLYGLSVFWDVVKSDDVASSVDRDSIEHARVVLATIVHSVYVQLRSNDFKIRDHTGKNDTNADEVKEDLLYLSLLGLYRHTVAITGGTDRQERIQSKYEDMLRNIELFGVMPADPFNVFSNAFQYFAWNLRFTMAATIWLNADDNHRPIISDYIKDWIYGPVKGHKNAWFTLVYAMTTVPVRQSVVADGVLSLKSWSLRPHRGWPSPLAQGWGRSYSPPSEFDRVTGRADSKVLWPHLRKPTTYWTWAKDPWDAGEVEPAGIFDGVAIDLTLPYWMSRYYGLIQ